MERSGRATGSEMPCTEKTSYDDYENLFMTRPCVWVLFRFFFVVFARPPCAFFSFCFDFVNDMLPSPVHARLLRQSAYLSVFTS